MSNELQIRLSADIKQLQTALSRAKKTIKDFETETEKGSERSNVGFKRKIGLIEQLESKAKKLRVALRQATSEEQVERYNMELVQTTAEMTRLNALGRQVSSSVGNTGAAFKRAGSSIGGTNSVAIEFNRIIQDAPFGLIGIGNNLQQLAGNFANVRSQAGSTGQAIKASLTSIISPVNLGVLALSALTAGFTAYQMGAFDFIKTNKDAVDEIKKFREELDKFKESLDAVSRARLDGISSAQKELTIVEALSKQASNTLVDDKNRLSAVKELIKRYPKYLGHLSEEDILLGKTGGALKRLTNDLEQSEIAQSSATAATEKKIEALEVEERLQRNLSELQKNRAREGELVRAGARDIRGLTESRAAGVIFTEAEKELLRLRRQQPALLKEIKRDGLELNRITDDQVELQNTLNKALEKGGTLTSDFTDKTKEVEGLVSGFNSLNAEIEKVRFSNETAAEAADKLLSRYRDLQKELGLIDFDPVDFEVDFDPSQQDQLTEAQKKVIDNAVKARELAKEFQDDITKIGSQLSNVFAESFERGIFEGENFFDSIAQGFKRLLAQLASQLATAAFLNILAAVTTGGASTFFSAAAGSNPFGALFGGARADGGPVSSSKAYLVGERGPEIFQPSTSGRIIPNMPSYPMVSASGASDGVMQKIDVNVYGQIMNDRIVLSNQRGNRDLGRFYGING